MFFDHVSTHILPLLSENQFGFIPFRSTTQQLLRFLMEMHAALQNKSHFDTIYLDISKVFDSVPHDILLIKLAQLGIRGPLWLWFRSYQTNHKQVVKINNQLSDPLPVSYGVPQGSILGPLLFLIFINDIVSCISYSKILLFADDSKCFCPISVPRDYQLLQKDINSLLQWFSDDYMDINSTK